MTMKSFRSQCCNTASALVFGALAFGFVAACSSEKSDVPVVSGNTVDRWNQLDKILPEAPLVNVSYRFNLVDETEIRSDILGEGQGWVYASTGEWNYSSQVVVSLVSGPDERDIASSSSITVGRQQFDTLRYCLTADRGRIDDIVAPYVRAVNGAGGKAAQEYYVQVFTSRAPDTEGRYVDIVYFETLEGSGQACDADGGLKVTGGEGDYAPEALRDRAERSFDVLG